MRACWLLVDWVCYVVGSRTATSRHVHVNQSTSVHVNFSTDLFITPLYQQHASHTLASRAHGPQPQMRSPSANVYRVTTVITQKVVGCESCHRAGPQDSDLTLENFAKEEAWLSGAQSLNVDALSWEQYKPPAA